MADFQFSLPDNRQVMLAADTQQKLCAGCIVLDGVQINQDMGAAEASSALAPQLQEEYRDLLPSQIPGLAEARNLYKSFGMDPSRHRPSSEALLRRVLKGKDLYRLNNVVDSCNHVSLSLLLPIGMYDLAKVQGDITLRTGLEAEQYPGIRKGTVNLAGRLGLFDQQGPFGSPTSDSARTCVTSETTSVLAVIMATGNYSCPTMDKNLDLFARTFGQFCHGREISRAVLGGVD